MDMKDGLSQMKVSSIIEGPKGYIWVGTRNGLNRFNGSEFTIYGMPDGLSSNRILDLALDSSGQLVILTDKGLDFFDGSRVRSYPREFLGVDYGMVVDRSGRIWIMTFSQLSIFESGNFTSKQIPGIGFNTTFNPQKQALCIVWGKTVCNVYGDFEIDTITSNSVHVRTQNVRIASPYPIFAFPDSKTPKQYYYFNGPQRQSFITLKNGQPDYSFLPYHFVLGDGVYFVEAQNQPVNIQTNIILPQKLFTSSRGKLWVGGENGLEIVDKSAFFHFDYSTLPYIWTIIEDNNENIYFASYGQGLFKQTREESIQRIPAGNNNLFHSGSTIDEEGVLHFAHNDGIYSYENDVLSRYFFQTSMDVIYDNQRNRLVSGALEGIDIFENKQRIKSVKVSDGLHSNYYIQNISVDRSGNYWLGSYQGLSKYNPDTDAITNYTQAAGNLPLGPGLFSSFVDARGTVWLGGENGLMYFDTTAQALIPIESAIMQNQIKAIVDFDRDHLLLASKDELYLFDTKTFFQTSRVPITVLNGTNGYQGVEPGFNSLYKSRSGQIYICSSTSVDILYPDLLTERENFPQANIVSVDHTVLPIEHHDSIYVFSGTNLLVQAEAVGLSRPFHTKFNFKVDHAPWVGWQEEATFNAANLRHGTHKITVAAGPVNNPDDSRYKDELNIDIQLPLHKRAFFIPSVLSLLGIVSIFFFVEWFRAFRSRKKLHAQLVESRYLKSQLLLSELNPHFIFNVLASIQNKIVKGNKDEASDHLVRLSGLIRNYLDSSYRSNDPSSINEFEISLAKEIQLLDSYIKFEQETNNQFFEYKINVEEDVAPEATMIPPLLIQPFVENAIKHGLLPLDKKGKLEITFQKDANSLNCIIQDNGPGFDRAKPRIGKKDHTSYGMRIIAERISILNELGYNIEYNIDSNPDQGTRVVIKIVE